MSSKAQDPGRDRINQREAAALIGRTPEWLQLRERRGTAPASFREGRERVYSRAGVLAWARKEGLLP